jgi:hypothetical protein
VATIDWEKTFTPLTQEEMNRAWRLASAKQTPGLPLPDLEECKYLLQASGAIVLSQRGEQELVFPASVKCVVEYPVWKATMEFKKEDAWTRLKRANPEHTAAAFFASPAGDEALIDIAEAAAKAAVSGATKKV